jgi:hypothetical protein
MTSIQCFPRMDTAIQDSLEQNQSSRCSLAEYLKREIFPGLAPPPYGDIKVRRLSEQKPVYLFLENTKNLMVVGKSFQHDSGPLEQAWLRAEKEYSNLKLLRERFGMNGDSYQVVAPLGKNKELSAMLVTKRAPGRLLDHYISEAVFGQRYDSLFCKLGYLANFFVKLHRNTENSKQVSIDSLRDYLGKLLDCLSQGPLNRYGRDSVEQHALQWFDRGEILESDREVVVHGDATPTNFVFCHQDVRGIDLEKMTWGDRCWDLGFMAAELKHHFMWRTGNGWTAEQFIGHFLWEYAASYNRDTRFFHAITSRIPVYMALGLLRIARNDWLDAPYRRNLIREAKRCLKYGLSSSITMVL